ncbi:hypothetical protein [Streptomyces sp. SAJ15]|uniref:AMIN-like domain-containing (lipo)protein n=1 Tax=Streptomyces sp. SAJ15 TaxID=2011095 RepID=UPI001186E0D8|nr:hypothetical protein [Streptomyces sp. SAJ15]TVL93516.1 hypothetical protein CD790_00105 [Streptomyces sp. SAJ15]
MRRWGTAVTALALAGAGLAATAGTADAAPTKIVIKTAKASKAANCAVTWGSGDKSGKTSAYKPLTGTTASKHECFDRLVFNVPGSSTAKPVGFHVGYVDKFYQDGSGDHIPVNGGAILQVFVSAPSYNPETGKPTYPGKAGKTLPGVNISGFKTFKDTRFGASFEGQTQVAVGTRAKLPFRVQQSGDKVIVDVAHSWTAVR